MRFRLFGDRFGLLGRDVDGDGGIFWLGISVQGYLLGSKRSARVAVGRKIWG